MAGPLQYRLMGPVEVRRGKAAMTLPNGAPLAVLAILLVNMGQIVSTEKLIEMLWEDSPTKTARVLVSQYVKGLREAFADAGFLNPPVKRQGPGYVVLKESGTLDITVFRGLVRDAHELARRQEWASVSETLTRARALRRDEPFADINCPALTSVYTPLLHTEYMEATEDWVAAELHLGRHRDLLPELRELAVNNPHHEQAQALLMRALYQDGQQAEALEAYRRVRQALNRDFGLEPGERLREMYQLILSPARLPTVGA